VGYAVKLSMFEDAGGGVGCGLVTLQSILMAQELSETFSQALQEVLKCCEDSTDKLFNSQNRFEITLAALANKVEALKALCGQADDAAIARASQKLTEYRVRMMELKQRTEALKRRVLALEAK
jgi:hypothetical protein